MRKLKNLPKKKNSYALVLDLDEIRFLLTYLIFYIPPPEFFWWRNALLRRFKRHSTFNENSMISINKRNSIALTENNITIGG